ncbi:MAG: HesA/MoeB/ThiF family protein [Gammaproteobacteria bacterium]|nr:HesA/MoeB/ThiF family protein [Gammaproteobacteria bacterium]
MNDQQHERYSRQMLLPWLGLAGQQRLMGSRVLVLGLGGLGSPVTQYLAAAGVGTLALCDYDNVELSNLQRQVLHRSTDVGRPKAESAADAVRAINPDVKAIVLNQFLQGDSLREQVELADVVVDACDNFESRYAVNEACVRARKPLVSGAAIRMEGQVSVFRNDRADAPCYRCLYRDDSGTGEDTCSLVGVLGPLVGMIGSIQAAETLKLLAGAEQGLAGRLLVVDALTMDVRSLRLRKDPDCPACGGRR